MIITGVTTMHQYWQNHGNSVDSNNGGDKKDKSTEEVLMDALSKMTKAYNELKKEYHRMEYDYSLVLDHATCSRMSRTSYSLDLIRQVIDQEQKEFHESIIKDDIRAIVDGGGDASVLLGEILSYLQINEKEELGNDVVFVEPEIISFIIRHNMGGLYEPIYDGQKIFKIPLNKNIVHYLENLNEYPKIKLMSEICINPLEVYIMKCNPDFDYIDALDVKPVDRRFVFEGEKYRFY